MGLAWRGKIPGAVLALSVLAAVPVRAADAPSPADWLGWVRGLAKSGYGVSSGSIRFLDRSACRAIAEPSGTCFGSDAAAPFLVPEVPADGTAADRRYPKVLSARGGRSGAGGMVYRLRETDAVLTVLTLPPQAAYLGYQSYLFTREAGAYAPDGATRHAVSPDPARYEILGSLGDAINNRVMAGVLGQVWGAGTVVIVTTADKTLADALAADAAAHGLDKSHIFVEPVGPDIRTGAGADADELISLIRYLYPADAPAGGAWLKAAAANARVFRVAAPSGLPAVRFGAPVPAPRQGVDEQNLADSLEELTALLHDWLERREGPPVLTGEMSVSESKDDATDEPAGRLGPLCIATGADCQGDTRDIGADRNGFVGPMDERQTVLVAGVNHAAMGNADLLSLSVRDVNEAVGVAGAWQTDPASVGFDGGILTGSAEGVLKALGLFDKASARLRGDLPKLYTVLVSHDCGPAKAYCIGLTGRSLLPLGDRAAIAERAFLKPGTALGADPDRLLNPVVIFRPAIGAQ